MTQWNLTRTLDETKEILVFSGGACNIRDETGKLLRSTERDPINEFLSKNNILFFDPQIHPDTHGTTYTYDIHQPMEVAARKHAKINLFEISPRTFGGATSLEIAVDEHQFNDPSIIYFSDGVHHTDVIPIHSADGYPLFEPYGIHDNDLARATHYKEYIKNANRLRRYLMKFAEDLSALTITFGEEVFEGDIAVTPHRMHSADIFRAVVRAAKGTRTIINFTGGEDARDEQGYPIFIAPENPRPADIQSSLDQYLDEGNELRRAIADLVRINVLSRVVYTQHAAIDALKDMLHVTGIRNEFVD